jgi:predicted TPR repeat methyltransferase
MQKLPAAADAEALTNRAAQLLAAGRIGAARPLLAAARRLAPGSIGVADISARLALRLNAPDEAAFELDQAIEAAPEHPGLRKRRAELRRQAGDIEGAARDAADAVVLDRKDATAKALLGILMLELGRTADAVACLAEASDAEPGNPGFATGLATAREAAGDPDAALAVLRRCTIVSPRQVEPRNAAILLCVRRRDFRQAIRLAEETRRAGIADACSFGLLGHALSSLGRHEEAADAYSEALKLGPDDPYVRHLVAAAGIVPSATRAPAEYLRAVFDGYADRFEQHLVALGYRMPGLFRAALRQHPGIAAGERVGPVLDLGCGTGLVALAIADLPVGPLIGVDIAPRMLAQAKAKGLYAELREADVMTVLGQKEPLPPAGEVETRSGEGEGDRVAPKQASAACQPDHPHPALRADPGSSPGQALSPRAGEVSGYPLILAADVFCYFGALKDVFAAAHTSLTPGGWLVCSVEELLPDSDGVIPGNGDWALGRQGRYAHSLAYIRDTAAEAGLQVLRLDRETLRYEANAPVTGLLVVLQRVRHDG